MKTSQIITIIILLGLVGIVAFISLKGENEAVVPLPIEQVSTIKGCYVATLQKDVYTLSVLKEDGENIQGTLSFKNFEKDSSSGSFSGTYRDGVLLGIYSFDSEGMHSDLQVIFKKVSDGFVRGYGDMSPTGDQFADLDNITYDTSVVFGKTSECEASLL